MTLALHSTAPVAVTAGWQWWQYVVAAAVTLGLSPAPWILAMLTRRLMPLGSHLERVADLKESHKREVDNLNQTHLLVVASYDKELDRLSTERDYERSGRETERSRSDAATGKLAGLASEFGDSTVRLLSNLRDANDDAPRVS